MVYMNKYLILIELLVNPLKLQTPTIFNSLQHIVDIFNLTKKTDKNA